MSGFLIGDMGGEHLSGVMEIERESFGDPWSEAGFVNEISNPLSHALAASEGAKVLGYAVAGRVLDEGHLLRLAVRPENRRQGIGAALAKAALARLEKEKCREVWLEVRASNAAGRKFYSSLGFRTRNLRKNYYSPPGEDAVVMSLTLEGGVTARPRSHDKG